MDFANRNVQHRAAAPAPAPAAAPHGPAPKQTNGKEGGRLARFRGRWVTLGALVLLFGGTILIVAMIVSLNMGGLYQDESKLVNKNEMQAVFVNVNGTNGGQVYFGNIKTLTSDYIQLTNVFYIQNQTTTANASSSAYNLVKLGCELHGPEDQMVINRSQVFFWENLKDNGQVAQKAAEFKKNNPNGQNCSQTQNTQQQTGSGTTTQQTSTGTTQQSTTTAPNTNTSTTTNR